MSPKNLNVSNKTHRFLLNKLKDKKILQIYKKFEKNLNIKENFIVAVSDPNVGNTIMKKKLVSLSITGLFNFARYFSK